MAFVTLIFTVENEFGDRRVTLVCRVHNPASVTVTNNSPGPKPEKLYEVEKLTAVSPLDPL